MKKHLFLVFIFSLFLHSCKKEETSQPRQVLFTTNNGNIDAGTVVIVPNKVNTNLNVNGTVIFTQTTALHGDLNQNDKGKIVFSADTDTSQIVIYGNANWNDTVIIKRGILHVMHDLNLNSRAVVNCSDSAKVIVENHFNQNGTVFGYRNFKVGVANLNGKILIEDAPRNW